MKNSLSHGSMSLKHLSNDRLKEERWKNIPPDYASGKYDPFSFSWNQIFTTTTPHKCAGSLVQDYPRGKHKSPGDDTTLIFFFLFWSRSFFTFDLILRWVIPSLQSLKVSSFGISHLDLWLIFASLCPVCLPLFVLHAYPPHLLFANYWLFTQLIKSSPLSIPWL